MENNAAGIVLFAHGSRIDSANEQVRVTAREMAQQGGYPLVEAAFLELAQPDLPSAVDRLADRGAGRVVVVPYFLTLGTHMQRDLPVLLREAADRHPGLEISSTPPLDGHAALIQILRDRADAALGMVEEPA